MSTYKKAIGPNDTMPFGKYKGCFLSDVMKVDPGYMMWAFVNMDAIEWTHEAVKVIRGYIDADAKRTSRYRAMLEKKKTSMPSVQVPDDNEEEILDLEKGDITPVAVMADPTARYAEWGAF